MQFPAQLDTFVLQRRCVYNLHTTEHSQSSPFTWLTTDHVINVDWQSSDFSMIDGWRGVLSAKWQIWFESFQFGPHKSPTKKSQNDSMEAPLPPCARQALAIIKNSKRSANFADEQWSGIWSSVQFSNSPTTMVHLDTACFALRKLRAIRTIDISHIVQSASILRFWRLCDCRRWDVCESIAPCAHYAPHLWKWTNIKRFTSPLAAATRNTSTRELVSSSATAGQVLHGTQYGPHVSPLNCFRDMMRWAIVPFSDLTNFSVKTARNDIWPQAISHKCDVRWSLLNALHTKCACLRSGHGRQTVDEWRKK